MWRQDDRPALAKIPSPKEFPPAIAGSKLRTHDMAGFFENKTPLKLRGVFICNYNCYAIQNSLRQRPVRADRLAWRAGG